MSQHTEKDILSKEIDYMNITLMSKNIKVLVIGAGRAGFIKSKSFSQKGCEVTVVALEFCKEFQELINIKKVITNYKIDFIKDKHLIVIAVDDEKLIGEIVSNCEEENKLFLNCTDFKEGNFIVPSQSKTKNINYSINTLGGNPKTSTFLVKTMGEKLREYDNLVSFSDELRKKIKISPYKSEILDFVASEDFNFFIKKAFHIEVLNLFYRGDNFEFKNIN